MTTGQPHHSPSEPRIGTTGDAAGSELKRAVLDAAERVQQIIDAAERAAGEIRASAEREAAEYVASRTAEADRLLDAKSTELAAAMQPLVQRLEQMHQDARDVVEEVERLLRRTGRATAAAPPQGDERAPEPSTLAGFRARLLDRAPARRREPTDDVPSVRAFPGADATPAGGRGTAAPGGSGDASDQALLRATQMAVAGSDRAEIERVLRDELGIAEPGPVVTRVLGGG